jgi:hypothetical protein
MKPYWTDGQVTLYHGDCREVTEWLTFAGCPGGVVNPRNFMIMRTQLGLAR